MASVRSNYNKLFGDKEKKNTELVCCMDCVWARLIQYGTNPVLADCLKKPDPYNEKFPYERQVASARWICPIWKHDNKAKEIEHRKTYDERKKGVEAA